MIKRHLQSPLFHRAVVHGDTIYLSGVTADDKSVSVGGQTTQILEKIDALLRTLNSDSSHLLRATVYLTDMNERDEMNAAWSAFFQKSDLPARATIGVAQLTPKTLVEVVATAAVRLEADQTHS